jgi:hypothetical protein
VRISPNSDTKWQRKERQFKVGDIVLLVDDNLPRGKWNMARVVEVFPGKDGIVRNEDGRVQTISTEMLYNIGRFFLSVAPEGCYGQYSEMLNLKYIIL